MALRAALGYLPIMRARFASLSDAAAELGGWLRDAALPLWTTNGWDGARGGFEEALDPEGRPAPGPRRSRVQTRQIWVCATAARAGLGEGYGDLAAQAYGGYRARYRRDDGLFAFSATPEGRIVDPTPWLYEQAFVLLALSALHRLAPTGGHATEARAVRTALEGLRHAPGGWREAGPQPFQANAHMHLLEAALAWEAAGEADWAELSDAVAKLALDRFVDRQAPVLREFFDPAWVPVTDDAGQLIEPGHQFEWATLLDRWAELRGRDDVRRLARSLYATGLRGVDPASGMALNALSGSLAVVDAGGRLWAQTEHLKAALVFGEADAALGAAQGLAMFLQSPRRGAWRDRRSPDGAFLDGPAPATSLYHLTGAILALGEAV
jgi:mannose-1-phosphate guanylyltransferase/mannose-6-phosphate isomerase